MKSILITALFFALSIATFAQSSFLPQNLGPAINSMYDDVNPVISPDGKTLFFTRVNHPENTYGERDSEDIWYATRVNDSTWSTATPLSKLNIGRYNAVLSVSQDGNTLLLNGVFNKKGDFWKKRGLSVSSKVGNEWSAPERLKVKKLSKKNRGMRSSASMSADGKVIILSYSKVFNGERNNLYVTRKSSNGKWGRPKKLSKLNTSLNEQTPFIAADGKTIYFSRNGGAHKDFNIYKSVRSGSDWKSFSKPVLLSDTVNTTSWESYFKTNHKGSYAYFASARPGGGMSDIYSLKLFEEKPFVVVSGVVLNEVTGQPLKGKKFAVLVDGKPADSLKMSIDSASYQLTLKLGKRYEISTVIENYTARSVTLDVSKSKEFHEAQANLKVKPFPYVLVKGKLLVQNTGLNVSPTLNPEIKINGLSVDSMKVDIYAGTFEIKLNHGRSYEFQLSALRHESLTRKLDLTEIDEYQEMSFDLFVEEVKMAIIRGNILDKKTGKPLTNLSAAKVNVEGAEVVFATIDTLTGAYQLKLPFGTSFTISAAAPNYYPLYETIDLNIAPTNIQIMKDLVIIPIEVGQSIRLNNIFFDAGKTILSPASYPELDRVVEFLTASPEIKVEIAGHTDNVGKAATNKKLSLGRASAVADYLVSKGLSKDRVVPKGYGSEKPVASNATAEGKAQNRRVEFTVLDN